MSAPTAKLIRTNKATIRLIDSSIIYIRYDNDTLLDIHDFKEAANAYFEITEGQQFKVLVEFPLGCMVTAEARQWAEMNSINSLAGAIVFSSLAQHMLVRFYLIFRRHTHPIRSFRSVEDAKEWLTTLST